jgi:hypothetical protein
VAVAVVEDIPTGVCLVVVIFLTRLVPYIIYIYILGSLGE